MTCYTIEMHLPLLVLLKSVTGFFLGIYLIFYRSVHKNNICINYSESNAGIDNDIYSRIQGYNSQQVSPALRQKLLIGEITCREYFSASITFYQKYTKKHSSNLHKTLSIHRFKNQSHFYSMLLSNKIQNMQQLRYKALLQTEEIDHIDCLLERLNTKNGNRNITNHRRRNYVPLAYGRNRSTHLVWENTKHGMLYSANMLSPRKPNMYHAKKLIPVKKLLHFLTHIVSKDKNISKEFLSQNDSLNIYFQIDPLVGRSFRVHSKWNNAKHKSNRTVENTLHFVRQYFTQLEFVECPFPLTSVKHNEGDNETNDEPNDIKESKINFIVPLSERLSRFSEFISQFEQQFLRWEEKVSIVFVLFNYIWYKTQNEKVIQKVRQFKSDYTKHMFKVVMVGGQFQRSAALQAGASIFPDNALLFFIDIDCLLSRDILHRIRTNTIRGKQVFFPIMFSRYASLIYFVIVTTIFFTIL